MIPKKNVTIFLLGFLSYVESITDFCVADYNAPNGPAGYACKDPGKVTVDDFVYSGIRVPGNTSNIFKFSSTPVRDNTFPGLNGMGLSMSRFDFGVDAAALLHSHRATELLIVIEGTIIAGFIATDNTAYYKTLKKGDIMIFPPSLLHFQVNVGKKPAQAFVIFNSQNAGSQLFDSALFGNNLPTWLVEKIALVGAKEVNRLKKIFHGSN